MDQDSRSAAVGRKKQRLNNNLLSYDEPPSPSSDGKSSLDDGEIQSDEQPDDRSGSDSFSVGDEPLTSNYQNATSSQVRVEDLDPDQRQEQKKYFGICHPEELVRCMNCVRRGHMFSTCPDRTCKHCDAVDRHWHGSCPTLVRCSRCKNSGHTAATCKQARAPTTDPCRICDVLGHWEKECPRLGFLTELESPPTRAVLDRMIVSCYNCGSSGHWGDDCPRLSRHQRNMIESTSPWSAEAAARYTTNNHGQARENSVPPPTRNWQMSMFDDMRD